MTLKKAIIKTVLLLGVIMISIFFIGCNVQEGEKETKTETVKNIVYDYKISAVQAEPIEWGMDNFQYPYETYNDKISYTNRTQGNGKLTSYTFLGNKYEFDSLRNWTISDFPRFPMGKVEQYEYGITNNPSGLNPLGFFYFKSGTTELVEAMGYYSKKFEHFNLKDFDAFEKSAYEFLSQYASLEGYDVNVEKHSTNSSVIEGAIATYRKHIDGYKTLAYYKLIVENRKSPNTDQITDWYKFCISDLWDQYKPYADAKIDSERVDKIIDEQVNSMCNQEGYELYSYQKDIHLVVLDDELKAYVEVSPDVKNKKTGDILGVPAFQMLIDIASME